MNITRKALLALTTLGLITVLIVTGCAGQNAGSSQPAKKTVKLAYVNWAECVAMTNLAQAILEDKGYNVETTMADVGPIFSALASGSVDAFLDSWLPLTHESYIQKFGENIDDYGIVYEGARIGLVVPEYVTINSIEELNDHTDKFEGQIIGIDAGAGIMKATANAISDYDLTFKLVESSEAAMAATLQKAIENEEWVVVTGWSPHWKFARWDLKFLNDPKKDYGEAEMIHKMGRQGLDEDLPEVANFLRNFSMNDQQLGDLEGLIVDGQEPLEAAKAWMSENQDIVNSWWD